MVWDPQKPKIAPLYPPMDLIWVHFVGKKADFGAQNRVFLKYVFFVQNDFPEALGSVFIGF